MPVEICQVFADGKIGQLSRRGDSLKGFLRFQGRSPYPSAFAVISQGTVSEEWQNLQGIILSPEICTWLSVAWRFHTGGFSQQTQHPFVPRGICVEVPV